MNDNGAAISPLRVRRQRQRQLEPSARRRPAHRPQQRHRLPLPGAGREQRGPRARPAAPATRSGPTAAPPRRTSPAASRTAPSTGPGRRRTATAGPSTTTSSASTAAAGRARRAARSPQQFGYDESHTLRVRAVSTAEDPARQVSGIGSASGRTVRPRRPRTTTQPPAADGARPSSTGPVPCDSNPAAPAPATTCGAPTCPPANGHRTTASSRPPGSAWGPAQFPHTVTHQRQRDFTGTGTCHVGSTPSSATRCGSAATPTTRKR